MRHSGEYQQATVEQLAERLARAHDRGHRMAVLLGAGASKSAGIPLAEELVDEIGEKYPQNVAGAERTYTAYMQRLTPSERDALLSPYVNKAKISTTYSCIANLVRLGYVDVILNVNFDWLAERSLSHTDVRPYVYDMADSQHYQRGRIRLPAVIYLHGRFGGCNNVHTDGGMEKIESRVAEVLKEHLSDRMVIVVGYSGLVDPVFDTLRDEFESFDHGLYWAALETVPPSHVLAGLLTDAGKQSYFVGNTDSDHFFAKVESELGLPPLPILKDPLAHMRSTLDQFDEAVSAPARIRIERYTKMPETDVHARPSLDQRASPAELRTAAAAAWGAEDYAALAELAPAALASEDEDVRKYVSWGTYNRATMRAEAALRLPDAERDSELLVACSELQQALRVFPGLTEGHINLGQVLTHLAKSGRFEDAERDRFRQEARLQFECAAEQAPAWSAPFSGLAGVLVDNSHSAAERSEQLALLTRASSLYWRAAYNNRNDHRILNNWGVALMEIAELTEMTAARRVYDEACEKFNRATLIAPDSPNAYHNWALTLHDRASRSGPDDTYELLSAAEEKYAAAIRLAPVRLETIYNRGVVLMEIERAGPLTREERYDLLGQASEMFLAATETNPDLFEGFYNRGNALVLRTSLALGAGRTADIESAVASLTKAVAVCPGSLEAHNNLGVALGLYAGLSTQAEEKLRLSLRAVDELRLVFGREPGEAKTMRALANTLQQFGRLQAPNDARATFREALGLYDELLRVQADEPGVWNECSSAWLGLVHSLVGQEREEAVAEAERHARRAEELKRGSGAYNLACAAALAGKKDEAFGLLEAALPATGETRSHIEADLDLDSLKNDPRWLPLLDRYRRI